MTKRTPLPEENRRGRRPGDPADKRTERLVLRIHPDLIDALNKSADEAGLTRSLFVERILLSYVRQDPRFADLDNVGRRRESMRSAPMASMRSFEQRWNRFAAMRRAAIGEDMAPAGPDLDDYGHPTDDSTIRPEPGPRPPVPQHLREPKAADRIWPMKSTKRKDRQKRGK
jgi:hypothetical protein